MTAGEDRTIFSPEIPKEGFVITSYSIHYTKLYEVVIAGTHPGLVYFLHHALVEDVVYQRRFSTAGHAGHQGQESDGDLHVDVLEIVLAAAFYLEEGVAVAARITSYNVCYTKLLR